MIMFQIVLAWLVLSLVTGGSLRNLQKEKLAGETVLFVILPLQLLWPAISTSLGLESAFSIIVWLLMMAALAGVLFYNAPRRWMLAFAGLGIAMNILVIGLNSGMPVSLRAAGELGGSREAARLAIEDSYLHRTLDDGTRLPFLADVIVVPGPEWQRGVASVGDLLLAVGLGMWVFAASRRAAD